MLSDTLAGEAKSYAERLFEYPRIDRLSRFDAAAALRGPAESRNVSFEEDALSYVFQETEGYPYFLQQYGKYAWDVASDDQITMRDAQLGGRQAQERLDEGFFLVRYERATTAQRSFLHAMAHCDGPPYPIAEIARTLGNADQRSISMKRNALIKKGLIFVPRHGTVDYTVPRFADYLRRRGESS